jgi:hypothetical protein
LTDTRNAPGESTAPDRSIAVVGDLELVALASDFDTVRMRLGLAMDAAGIGSFDLDLRSATLSGDERLVEMFGYDLAGTGRHAGGVGGHQ